MNRPTLVTALLALLLAAELAPVTALAQAPTSPTGGSGAAATPARTSVTILAEPRGAQIEFHGGLRMSGRSPLELPPDARGRFYLVVTGEGVARSQGVFRIQRQGMPAEFLSEPPGMSAGLLVRALNYPGFPSYTAERQQRGGLLFLAAGGGVFGTIQMHIRYRDRLDEFGAYSDDRAEDTRRARNTWALYTGAVWGLSALDYMTRPRFTIRESTPTQLSLDVPRVTRGAAMWRAILVPGSGLEYGGHRFRSATWLAAVLGAGAGVAIANVRIDQVQTKVDWARANVDSAGPSERQAAQQELELQQNQLQEDEDMRRGFIAGLVAVWVGSVIDTAIMNVPEKPSEAPRLRASIPITPDGPAIALHYRF